MKVFRAVLWVMLCGPAAGRAALPPDGPVQVPPADPKEGVHKEMDHDPWRPPPQPPPGYRAVRAGPVGYGPYVSVQVNVDAAGNNIPFDAANEPSIAVSPVDANKIVIGWRQFDSVSSNFRQAGWGYSHDGGATWTFPGVLEPGVFGSDPVVEADSDGNFYYYSLQPDRGPGEWACYLYKSFDGGLTWPQEVYARGGDKNWMTIDRSGGIGDGHIYLNWAIFFSCCNGDFTRSINGGLTFPNPVQVPGNPVHGTMSVAHDGRLYVCGEGILVARSSDAANPLVTPTFDLLTGVDLGGAGGGIGGVGPNPGGLLGQPWIDTDHSTGPTRGNVYVLSSVDPPGPDPLDVRFSRSTDGSASWSPSVRINDDPEDIAAWQWFGTMSVAPNGRIDVIWNDTRADPSGTYSQLYYSHSRDAGMHWSPNVALGPRWNSLIGHPNQNKIGDYYDMVSDNAGFYLAYAATYNGEQDVYFMRLVLDCNENGVPDYLDVSGGASEDCTGDFQPDECDPDCNSNGVADSCDLAFGTSADCTLNGTPDECERDCDGDEAADTCELALGAADCNGNGTPDTCELAAADCNGNGIPDDCDLTAGTSEDCTANGMPDECEPDCNDNGLADTCDIMLPVGSDDCDGNGVPDECDTAILDCNANGRPDACDIALGPQYDCDGNGAPDECDIAAGVLEDLDDNLIPDLCEAEVCAGLWSGFEPAPPFDLATAINGIDSDGDGSRWSNPLQSATINGQGCPSSLGKALKIVTQVPPPVDQVTSEFFRTTAGRLDCGAFFCSLEFDARSEAQLNPRTDWQLMVRDGKNDRNVVLLHWASTQSSFSGVGTSGRGKLLVQNPAGSPAFFNTGFALPPNTCYSLRVTLDNVTGTVEVFINGEFKVTTTRLQPTANRMDYFLLQQVANGQNTGGIGRLALDNFRLCRIGAALDWEDCDGNCVADEIETASGSAADCNSNGVPDACELDDDCNDNGLRDLCETAAGLAPDCNANGVPDACDVLGHNCCEAGHGPGCSNGMVQSCVCAFDPFCCTVNWDAMCVEEVTSAGCGGCGIEAGTSDCNLNGVPDECDNCADADADGDTDPADIAIFAGCLTGPGVSASASCRCALNVDSDLDLDLADYAGFQVCMHGTP